MEQAEILPYKKEKLKYHFLTKPVQHLYLMAKIVYTYLNVFHKSDFSFRDSTVQIFDLNSDQQILNLPAHCVLSAHPKHLL